MIFLRFLYTTSFFFLRFCHWCSVFKMSVTKLTKGSFYVYPAEGSIDFWDDCSNSLRQRDLPGRLMSVKMGHVLIAEFHCICIWKSQSLVCVTFSYHTFLALCSITNFFTITASNQHIFAEISQTTCDPFNPQNACTSERSRKMGVFLTFSYTLIHPYIYCDRSRCHDVPNMLKKKKKKLVRFPWILHVHMYSLEVNIKGMRIRLTVKHSWRWAVDVLWI